MLSNICGDSYYTDKMVSRLSYHYDRNLCTWKFLVILKQGQGAIYINIPFYQYRDPLSKIRWSCDSLIFNMKITYPERQSLFETGPDVFPDTSESHYNTVQLTHWRRAMHIYITNQTIIGSDNGLTPCQRQAIIWTKAGILLIEPSGTNFSEILIKIQIFSFNKMHLEVSSAKWWPFCVSLNVLNMILAKRMPLANVRKISDF